jgi:hypothetical protein
VFMPVADGLKEETFCRLARYKGRAALPALEESGPAVEAQLPAHLPRAVAAEAILIEHWADLHLEKRLSVRPRLAAQRHGGPSDQNQRSQNADHVTSLGRRCGDEHDDNSPSPWTKEAGALSDAPHAVIRSAAR